MNNGFQNYGEQMVSRLAAFLPRLAAALLILGLGWWLSNWCARLIYRAMTRGRADTGIVSFLCSLLKAVFKIIVCITAAAQLGINVNTIIATLGAAGVAIGLALKDNMANIASGAQIIFTKPFRAGDYLALQNVEGTVERIEIMFTTLRTFDNKEVVIPNSKITDSVITNYSARETRRLDLNYIVSYRADLVQAKKVLSDLAEESPYVLKEPAPLAVVGEHRENGISIGLKVWCKNDDYWNLYYDMQEKVKLAFDKAGISIPYHQMDVHFNPKPEKQDNQVDTKF
ncbi:MAG TPA: mechanosensitive ion channel family protein [Caproiciproducens sp.]|nr:mechanosensitive ion channel family protein [Caproiciproducens sp.]